MMEYRQAYGQESHGSFGSYGIKVMVAVNHELTQAEERQIGRSVDEILDEILAGTVTAHPDAKAATENNRKLVELFDEPIFVEEIPNGYCSRGCCRHLPWFVVTTKKGRITIGWRKSVINIDWKGSTIPLTAEAAFPNEDVTKFDQTIHAWSVAKARDYLNLLLK